MNFRVSTAALVAAASCVSHEETRYYLCGVAVQPHPEGGVLCVATDGHRMMVVRDDYGFAPRNLIIALNWKAKDLKPIGKEAGIRTLCLTLPEEDKGGTYTAEIRKLTSIDKDNRYEAGLMAAATAVDVIDGTFPEWNRVVPWDAFGVTGTKGQVGFNPDYIKPFGDAFGILGIELGWQTGACIHLANTEPGSPFLVSDDAVRNAFGVLMPKRTDAMSRPDWIAHKAPPPAPEQAADAAA